LAKSPTTFAEIDLSALTHNLETAKQKTRNTAILAVVKAGAYGHGAIRVAKHLLKKGVTMLGVAFIQEALELREAGIRSPIIVFFERSQPDLYLEHRLTPVIFDQKQAQAISSRACALNRTIPVHIKVDTGMGRVGFRFEDALPEIARIASMKNLRLAGLMSHFSDADMTDRGFTIQQLKRFLCLIRSLKEKSIRFQFIHIANSAGILRIPRAHGNMVRPGIMLYGYGPAKKNTLKPVLSLKSRIIQLKRVPAGTPISYGRTFTTKKESLIATVPVGYADGYNRKLSNRGEVLINGRRAPVAGRVCMDTTMIDVTGIPGVTLKSEVVFIGSQGKERITAQDIADTVGTIPYEVLTSIGSRVRRVYRSTS
jgi:alanine racemase